MARVQPPGKMPGRRRWLQRLLGACLAAAVLSWPATLAQASVAVSLPPPTGLNVTAADSSQISLSWTAPTPPKGYSVSGYEIYAGTVSGGESAAGSSSVTSFTMAGLTSGTTYYFYVTAMAGQNCVVRVCPGLVSAPSSEFSAATSFPVPGAPTGLIATDAGNSEIHLSWAAPPPIAGAPVTSYKVYDGTSSGAEILEGSSGTTSDMVTGLNSGTTYYFEVTAVNSAGESARSGEALATTHHAVHRRASQVIQFGPLARHLVGVQFTVVASASSGLTVSLSSDTPGVCSAAGLQVATINPGRCTITASQDGNAQYQRAPNRTRSFRVKPAVGRRALPQSITFARPANETAQRPVRLSATASSGLRVSFRSETPRVCSVSRRQVTIIKPGTCTITATQSGNTQYLPAPDQTRSFQVGPVPPQPPQPPQAPRAMVIVLGPIVLAAIVLAAAAGGLLLRRRRLRTRYPPAPRVRAEPHSDAPGSVHVRVTGPDVRGTVRIEPHQSYVYSRLERAQP